VTPRSGTALIIGLVSFTVAYVVVYWQYIKTYWRHR